MALQSIVLNIGGSDYPMAYDSANEQWAASFNAPPLTSWGASADHKLHGTLTLVDGAGNETLIDTSDPDWGEALKLRVRETVAPVVSITAPSSGATTPDATPTVTAGISDGPDGSGIDQNSLTVRVDGADVTGAVTGLAWASGVVAFDIGGALADGPHTVEVEISDNDGNTGSAASTFEVMTAAPALNVSAPLAGLETKEASMEIQGSTDAPSSMAVTVAWEITGAGLSGTLAVAPDGSFSGAVGISSLPDGDYDLTVTATNGAGLSSSVTRAFVVDRTPPVVVGVEAQPGYDVATGTTMTFIVRAHD